MVDKIKCSATRHGDFIVMGAYHGECMKKAFDLGLPQACPRMGQGFMTNKLRFVLRKEALMIAEKADQIKFKHNPKDRLLSEDLKKDGE